jgi:hypothetical protein
MARIRTNIEIEEVYVRRIMDRYGIHTKTEAVDLALRHLAGRAMTREGALATQGAHAVGEIPPDSPPAETARYSPTHPRGSSTTEPCAVRCTSTWQP